MFFSGKFDIVNCNIQINVHLNYYKSRKVVEKLDSKMRKPNKKLNAANKVSKDPNTEVKIIYKLEKFEFI